MDARKGMLSRIAMLFLHLLLALHIAGALNVGLHSQSMTPVAGILPFPFQTSSVSFPKDCSTKCESVNCLVPPLLRYGKYCGIMYTGCPGEEPCDALDTCCLRHDTCIASHGYDYLNEECNEKLLECVREFRESGAPSFEGNTCEVEEVVDLISFVIQGALMIGRLHL